MPHRASSSRFVERPETRAGGVFAPAPEGANRAEVSPSKRSSTRTVGIGELAHRIIEQRAEVGPVGSSELWLSSFIVRLLLCLRRVCPSAQTSRLQRVLA
jgi:hypothetical protein